MVAKESRPGPRKAHPPRQVKPKQHDPYARRRKPADALVCDECGVIHHGGQWRWGAPPLADARGGLCPACERIRDRYPAGTIRVPRGLYDRPTELLHLIRSVEEAERIEHPLERVIEIQESDEGMVITTTGLHMARCLASQLGRRFNKKPSLRYPPEDNLVFVDWQD